MSFMDNDTDMKFFIIRNFSTYTYKLALPDSNKKALMVSSGLFYQHDYVTDGQ